MIFDNLVAPADEPTDQTGATDERDGRDADEGEGNLVIEFTVPAEDFVLSETLGTVPHNTLEFEQLVPTTETLLPYLWVKGDRTAAFEKATTNDSSVEELTLVATFDQGALYRVTWSESADRLVTWLRENDDAVVLQTETTGERWLLKLRVGSRGVLGGLQSFCRERDIGFDVVRLSELTDPKVGQFNVSEKQYETLLLALEMGYFEIPREATLEDLAERLDISARAVSERLRRGQTNLLNNSLTIGEPTGIGIGREA